MNLADIIEGHNPDRPAIIDGDRPDEFESVVSYGRLRELVASVRTVLSGSAVGPDDRVALLAGIEVDFVVGALAILGQGAVVAPISVGSPLPELRRKLSTINTRLLLIGDEGRWALEHREELANGDAVALLDLFQINGSAPGDPGVDPTAEPTASANRTGDDLAFLMLTSGVSSEAKVAMLSHDNLSWVQEASIADPGVAITSDDVVLCALPLAHIFGLNAVVLPALRAGATLVLHRRFDAAATLASIERHRVTMVGGAPPMWRRWAEENVPSDSLASVRFAASGAAPLPSDVFDRFLDRYGLEIRDGYGLTETSPTVTSSREGPIKPGSVGRPMPGVEVVLAEPDGSPVDVGDSGEIVIRSPGVFGGYLDAPELTSAVLTDDGWFWTGDVGVFDDDGYLYIVDRLKDVIIVSGFNVYPSEVEATLMEHPGVTGAAVVGRSDDDTGEAVVAHITGSVDADELDPFMRARLSGYKCPSEYLCEDELPLAPTGKLIRRELRR